MAWGFTYVHNGTRTRVEACLFQMMGKHFQMCLRGHIWLVAAAANDD